MTGSRTEERHRDATAQVEVIDRRAIESAGAENVAEVLETHPGVDMERGLRGFAARLQGLDPEYVLILVDGERTQGRLGGGLDLTRFPTDNVERIEIVKGAGSALHGSDAIAGVINIITRRARRPLEASGHLSGGTLGTMDASARVATRGDQLEGSLTAGHHRAAAYDLTPQTPEVTNSASRTSTVSASGGWKPGDRFQLRGRGQYLRRDQNGLGANATGAIFDRQAVSEDASATLEPEWRFTGGSRLKLTGHYGLLIDQFLSDQRWSSMLDTLQKTREHLGKGGVQLDLALGARHLLVAGSEVLHERMRSPRIADGGANRTRAAFFAQHEFRWLERPRLTLLPGVRLDTDSQFGFHASPKLAVRFDPVPTVALRAATGLAYRAPSFQELYLAFDNPGAGYMIAGNPELQPERSASFTLAGEWRPRPEAVAGGLEWVLSGGIFRTDIEDLIIVRLGGEEVVGVPSRFTYANVARATTQGAEAGVGLSVSTSVRVDLSYTFTDARDREDDRALEARARHRATFRLGYRHVGLGFSGHARGSLVGERPFYTDNDSNGIAETDWAPAHASLGVRLQQRVWRGVDAFAGGDNLVNNGDELYLPVPPRLFYGGLDFTF